MVEEWGRGVGEGRGYDKNVFRAAVAVVAVEVAEGGAGATRACYPRVARWGCSGGEVPGEMST